MMKSVLLFVVVVVVALSSTSQAFVVSPLNIRQQPVATENVPHQRASNRRSNHVVVFMGWGPEPIWTPAKVVSNDDACKSGLSVSIELELSSESSEYTMPGQYVQLRLDSDMEKPLFLAIASPPPSDGTNKFEFLVKKTDNNDWITSAKAGLGVEISQVLGNGFPLPTLDDVVACDFPTQNVMLFAAGSGIAPLKAAMESGQLSVGKEGRTARLYYGERTQDDLCFQEEFEKWEQEGFQVVPVLSQPSGDWNGREGYVQNALEEDGVPIPRNSCALLCGMKGMAESVKDLLTKAGVYEEKILTNF